METIFIIMVVVLFVLAISDLVVGVSNDAVNFLNSAIGSKAAPFWAIMIVASLGVLFGATFSSGMMEVARKGIFHPQYFYFTEIMVIFLAVMITDVILLDLFNTFGMPTSTTVSIVFELLGAAVAVSVLKITAGDQMIVTADGVEKIAELKDYINSAKALAIISGILLSVVVAFSVGALVQYLTRLAFSFNFKKNVKYVGAIWGGIAITAITYFILIKGLKGSSFASYEMENGEVLKDWVKHNAFLIILYSFIGWTILLQLLMWITKINILKVIVIVGTFALAMAFAGNDLVNFIGVPLAGFEAFKAFTESASSNPEGFLMTELQGKVATPALYLVIAGLIMVITLWLSKKAKSVVKTSLDLSNQDEVDERFGSSFMARSLVRGAINFNNGLRKLAPNFITKGVDKRFDQSKYETTTEGGEEVVAFDLVRASVNLVVASILISIGTSLKLPLSTTYVTFMVAMGTSLADRAWGRESAVYRVTGVIAVIGGWFFTAFIAFTVAFLVAMFISWGGIYAIALLVIIAVIVLYRTHVVHKRKESAEAATKDLDEEDVVRKENIVVKCIDNISTNMTDFVEVYEKTIHGLVNEDRKVLGSADQKVRDLNLASKKLKNKVFKTLRKLEDDSIETGPYYVQVLDYLREMAHSLTFITGPSFEHVNNNHKALLEKQSRNLEGISKDISLMFGNLIGAIKTSDYSELDVIQEQQEDLINRLEKLKKEHIKTLKRDEAGTRNSMLYFSLIYETRNFLLYSVNLLKAQRDFIQESK
jgi:phosphate/sulfate permease